MSQTLSFDTVANRVLMDNLFSRSTLLKYMHVVLRFLSVVQYSTLYLPQRQSIAILYIFLLWLETDIYHTNSRLKSMSHRMIIPAVGVFSKERLRLIFAFKYNREDIRKNTYRL